MSTHSRSKKTTAFVFKVLLAIPLIGLLIISFTVQGVFTCLIGIVLVHIIIDLIFKAERRLFNAFKFVIVVVFAGGTVLMFPYTRQVGDYSFQHHNYRGTDGPESSFFDFWPEQELQNWGMTMMSIPDRHLTIAHTRDICNGADSIYQAIDADPEWTSVRGAAGEITSELLGGLPNRGHYMVYRPDSISADEKTPVIVFLHGFGGPWVSYLYVMKSVADETGCTVVAPSYGLGFWDEGDIHSLIDSTLQHAASLYALDQSDAILCGLSNGGMGVSRSIYERPDQFKAYAFFSPAYDQAALDGLAAQTDSIEAPVFLISGGQDKRCPMVYQEESAAILEQAGATLSFLRLPNQDHFYFFTAPEFMQKPFTKWIKSVSN